MLLLYQNEKGQGLVEYSLILALVVIVVALIVVTFGGTVGNMFSRITNQLP